MTVSLAGGVGGFAGRSGGSWEPEAVWAKASAALRSEMSQDTYNSWLAQAGVRQTAAGELVLVTPTGIARDWVRRNAWRRVTELWSQYDPERRALELKSRADLDSAGVTLDAPSASVMAAAPSSSASTSAAPCVAPQALAQPSLAQPSLAQPAAASPAALASEEDDAAPSRGLGLQERFRFDTFVPGPGNEFAHTVAKRVASWSDGHFNPVVFHGPYGFGKTHMLNAIAWEAMRSAPGKKVIYLTAERFLQSFVKALMDRSGPAFKEELRAADLLLIDDVHFIAGKQSSQEELYHTLAALTQDGRRVVFTADRAPNDLVEMDARLRSHLQAGLVCGIEPADRTLRLGILERKLATLGRSLDVPGLSARPEVMQFLADRFTDSVRELEGALNTLVARMGEGVAGLGLDEAQAILRPHLRGAEKRITVDEIQKATAEHYSMKQADLISERRNRAIARPRQVAMWLAKSLTTRSLPDIGRRFGGRDHTTVLHAVRRIEALRMEDAQLARDLEVLTRKLRG
ncbi:MAG: chromosomal replication initiator protein DnaA [Caulobacteraceae bacterium]|nr:chromosomal replication initiator protein DnaA [Caulobacteraceae bacterium]